MTHNAVDVHPTTLLRHVPRSLTALSNLDTLDRRLRFVRIHVGMKTFCWACVTYRVYFEGEDTLSWEEQRGLSSDYARHDYWPAFAPFIAQCTTLTPTHSKVSINCVPAPPCIPLQKDSSETNRASRFLILTEFQTRCRSNSSTVSRRDTHIAILKSLSTMRRCTQRRPPKFQAV
ncbi:hypothetical protein BC629DRAFT_1146381 [Irpex lacteus]|nr:hypothetical protein BC629DRAFT_1146381 [Irpex lacteus]